MLARQMGEYLQNQINAYMAGIFVDMGITYSKEDIWHDFAQVTPVGFKANFYIKTIENVKRKQFHELAGKVKKENPQLKTLKVKSKRPNNNVRFEIEVVKEVQDDSSTVPQQA